jgi:2-polyprenyl-6-methoxyphenol hydroxylase-like FAD-dependent oxidoreductase
VTLPTTTSVLIAGGGPVGLATAVELGTRGVDCVVLEPRAELTFLRPRAKTSSVRTMEHFRRWGLADHIRKAANLPVAFSQEAVVCASLLGREITRFGDCFGLAPQQRAEFAESGQQVAQPIVEKVLRDAVADLPTVTFAVGWAVRSLAEDADAVVVEAAGPDGASGRVAAQYVVGCDGPNSTVREAIGARLLGDADGRVNLNVVFRAPGLAERVPHGPAVHYWVFNPRITGVMGPFDLHGTWWAGIGGAGASDGGQPSPERVADLLAELVGERVDGEVLCTDSWNARMQLADTVQTSRVFLAGDAAHLNPPWGGHGYNTGIGDAVNIGWKLAATLQGWGGAALPASYSPERRAVAEQTIADTTLNMRAVLSLRGITDPDAAASAIQQAMNGEFHSLGLVLGYEYANSPVIAYTDAEHPRPPLPHRHSLTAYTPSTRPGARLPHQWLPDGRSLYDTLGPALTLLRTTTNGGEAGCAPLIDAAHRRAIPLAVADIPNPNPAYADVTALLVRPDHHIAWRSQNTEVTPQSAHAILDHILGIAAE